MTDLPRRPKVGEIWTDQVTTGDGRGYGRVQIVKANPDAWGRDGTVEFTAPELVSSAESVFTMPVEGFLRWFGFLREAPKCRKPSPGKRR